MRFFFYISQSRYPVTRKSPNWKSLLPLSRQSTEFSAPGIFSAGITCGDYFKGAASFLSQNRFAPVRFALHSLYQVSGEPDGLKSIRIFLVKHGEFYHPSQVEVELCGKTYLFVLNVAVSSAGIALMETEYPLLRRLGDDCCPHEFLPRVFSFAKLPVERKTPIAMFLGQWFEGFCEFHLSRKSGQGGMGIVVWDDGGNYFLDDALAVKMYEQAAKILTLYYNPASFEQIFSWHHAAGDFILKTDGKAIDLRLITVRKYLPLIQTTQEDPGDFLDALLMFFLILSIRMRLDRLDGTGEYAWAPDPAVNATIAGFAMGLNQQAKENRIPFELVDAVYHYLTSFSFSALSKWASLVVERFFSNGTELALIRSRLFEHVKILHAGIRDVFFP